MNLTQHLVALIDAYAAAKALSPSRVTTIVLGSGSMDRRLRAGKTITVDRFEKAVAWFDAHWPNDLPWPQGLPRPSLAVESAKTEAA